MIVSEEKKLLRTKMRAILASYFAEGVASRASLSACKKLIALESYSDADIVLAYIAHGNEASCQDVIFDALNRGKTVACPRVKSGTSEMDFFCLNPELSFGDQFESGSYGISEPVTSLEKLPAGPATLNGKKVFVVVPGLAFTRSGLRLGKGKGFYDRYIKLLAQSRASVTLAAFAFSCQIQSTIPQNDNDRSVHLIVTENGVIDCSAS